jgi:hypothetical protein
MLDCLLQRQANLSKNTDMDYYYYYWFVSVLLKEYFETFHD